LIVLFIKSSNEISLRNTSEYVTYELGECRFALLLRLLNKCTSNTKLDLKIRNEAKRNELEMA